MRLPDSTISMALDLPTAFVNLCVPPAPVSQKTTIVQTAGLAEYKYVRPLALVKISPTDG